MADPIQALLDALAPEVRRAFLVAIADIKSDAQLAVIVGALERRDVEAAIQAMNLRPEFFAPLDDALRGVYLQGGRDVLAGLPSIADPFPVGAWLRASTAATRAQKAG